MESKALEFATFKHTGQTRKFSGEPYITHPVRVAETLRYYGYPQATISAGYLHDVLEDTDATLLELESEFGSEIARLVEEVTNNKELMKAMSKGNYQAMRICELSKDALAIKLADRLDNTRDMKTLPDQEFARRYSEDTLKLLKSLLMSGRNIGSSEKEMATNICRYLVDDVSLEALALISQ